MQLHLQHAASCVRPWLKLHDQGVPRSPCSSSLLSCPVRAGLEKVLPSPKPKPVSWVSAVYPETSDDPNAQVASAGYQVLSQASCMQTGLACR